MTYKITLPPLPDCKTYSRGMGALYSADQLRARDIEVARLVLEAAAKVCGCPLCADDIRAMEVSHD